MSNKQANPAQVKQALQIISDNFSFFAAPFVEVEAKTKNFKKWAIDNAQAMELLSNELIKALDLYHTKTAYAGHIAWRKGLLKKDDAILNKLLQCSPALVNVILQHANDPIINKWYQDHNVCNEGKERINTAIISSLQNETRKYKQQLAKKIEHEAKSLKNDKVTAQYYNEQGHFLVEKIQTRANSGYALWNNLGAGVTVHTSRSHPTLHRTIELYNEIDTLDKILLADKLPKDKKIQQYRTQFKRFEASLQPDEKTEPALVRFLKQVGHILTFGLVSKFVNGTCCFWKVAPTPGKALQKIEKPLTHSLMSI